MAVREIYKPSFSQENSNFDKVRTLTEKLWNIKKKIQKKLRM